MSLHVLSLFLAPEATQYKIHNLQQPAYTTTTHTSNDSNPTGDSHNTDTPTHVLSQAHVTYDTPSGAPGNLRQGVWVWRLTGVYRVVQKTDTQIYFSDNFGNSAPILNILSLLQAEIYGA